MVVLADGSGGGVAVAVANWGAEGGQSIVLLLLLCLSMLFLFFLRSLLFSNYSSVFYGVLPSYGGAAIVGDVACGDRTLVPDGGEKNQSLLLFFPSMQRHQFLIFLHDCCSVAHRGKKMARG